MKKVATLLFATLVATAVSAQKDISDNFNQAKLHLANHKLNQAIPILERLWKEDPSNANLNYLLGLCYVKEDIQIPKSVELLEAASSLYTKNYEFASTRERRAPEYVYYYLTIAYSKNKQCEEALRALNKFYQVYSYNDEYYLVDGQKWVRECNLEKQDEQVPPPLATTQRVDEDKPTVETAAADTPKSAEEEAKEAIMAEVIEERTEPQIKERLIPVTDLNNLRTKEVTYTTMSSQYGIQIASLLELKPTRDFAGLKNVEVYVDENGIFRYVIGRFPYKKQAETLLQKVRERGYADAFIVDVNTPMFRNEVLGLGASNINWNITGKVDFRVQVGAFAALVPGAVAQKYLDIDGIKEMQQNNLTILTVGSYATYEEAAAHREELKTLGIDDAFVVAFNLGNKIPLNEAKDFVERQKTDSASPPVDK